MSDARRIFQYGRTDAEQTSEGGISVNQLNMYSLIYNNSYPSYSEVFLISMRESGEGFKLAFIANGDRVKFSHGGSPGCRVWQKDEDL